MASLHSPVGRHHVEQVMGMSVSIDVRDRDVPDRALTDVVDWLHHVDATFSTYDMSSPISRLGRGEITLESAGDEIRSVLRLCEVIRADSEGAFDVLAVPAPNGTTLDPSGLVKGWAVERAADILEGHGCVDFCINAGGDVAVRGAARPGDDWRIGIRHPDLPDAVAAVVSGRGRLAVATSATYERGAHVIDPRTGEAAAVLASATVVGPDLTMADAYATAVFVMGLRGLAWLDGHPGYDAFLITREDTTHWTDGFVRYGDPTVS